jgi:MFS family permease
LSDRYGGLGGISRALASRDYRLYFIGNALSLLSSWINRMALGWLTWELTHSPAWLGSVAFAAMVPAMILGPISGTLGDRMGTRRTAMVAMLLEAANMTTLALLVATGLITVPLLFGMVLLQGILFSFDFPVRHSLVPDLVPRTDMSAAIAFNTTMFHLTSFVGPVIGGFIIAHFGIAPAFIVNIVSLILFYFLLRAMRLKQESHAGAEHGFAHDLWDGIRYAFTHPALRLLTVLALCFHVLTRPYYDMLPAFADQVFQRKVDGLAILASASGLGGLVGGVWLALRGRMQGLTASFIWASALSVVFLIAFALAPAFWLAAAFLVPAGVGLVVAGIASQSLVQNVVDPAKRARVVGLSASFATGGPALGALIIGWFGEFFGPGVPLAAAALVTGLIVLVAVPALKRMTVEMEADGTASKLSKN